MDRKHEDRYRNSSFEEMGLLLETGKTLGKPVVVNEELAIVPITRVTFGFGTGGSEFGNPTKNDNILQYEVDQDIFPYGGGTVGGVSIKPEAFLVIKKDDIKLVKMDDRSVYGKVLDMVIAAMKSKKK